MALGGPATSTNFPRPVERDRCSQRSCGAVTSDAAFPLRRASVPLRIGVRVVEHRGLRDLRVHALGPRVWPELTLQVLDGLADDLAGLGEINSGELVVALHYAAVDHDRVHVTA